MLPGHCHRDLFKNFDDRDRAVHSFHSVVAVGWASGFYPADNAVSTAEAKCHGRHKQYPDQDSRHSGEWRPEFYPADGVRYPDLPNEEFAQYLGDYHA